MQSTSLREFVVWEEARFSGDERIGSIRSVVRTPDGEWSEPATLAAGADSIPELLRLAANGRGDVLAAWSVDLGAAGVAYAAIRPAGEGAWRVPHEIATGLGTSVADVALDGVGNALVVVAVGVPQGSTGPLPPSTFAATWAAGTQAWSETRQLFRGGLSPTRR